MDHVFNLCVLYDSGSFCRIDYKNHLLCFWFQSISSSKLLLKLIPLDKWYTNGQWSTTFGGSSAEDSSILGLFEIHAKSILKTTVYAVEDKTGKDIQQLGQQDYSNG